MKATLAKQPGGVTVAGDDPKKYAAAVVEYTKVKTASSYEVQAMSKAASRGVARSVVIASQCVSNGAKT